MYNTNDSQKKYRLRMVSKNWALTSYIAPVSAALFTPTIVFNCVFIFFVFVCFFSYFLSFLLTFLSFSVVLSLLTILFIFSFVFDFNGLVTIF